MKQKKIILKVYNQSNEVVFEKDPASPQDVMSAITLFDGVGNCLQLEIAEFEIEIPSSMKS